ncbi:hypothetical protein DICVIV_14063 [Dictyocaulus viviparus]|uniref:Uncharacterized protein n=1 Tax=Dictyocaulus viviparus TaxID=29172 RepID=A0A0D8X8R3_DICVI|nr:hypothetical protein DICVIV_14063 [Dictyocaulus viviparus]
MGSVFIYAGNEFAACRATVIQEIIYKSEEYEKVHRLNLPDFETECELRSAKS